MKQSRDLQMFANRTYWSQQTPCPNSTRYKSTHGHHQMVNTEIKLIIVFTVKDGEAVYSQQKQDQELTVARIMNSLLLQVQSQVIYLTFFLFLEVSLYCYEPSPQRFFYSVPQVLGCFHFHSFLSIFLFLFFYFFCDLLVIQQRVVQPPYVGIFNSFSPVIEI